MKVREETYGMIVHKRIELSMCCRRVGFSLRVQWYRKHCILSRLAPFSFSSRQTRTFLIRLSPLQDLVQIVTNGFKTELREDNHWLLFAPIPVVFFPHIPILRFCTLFGLGFQSPSPPNTLRKIKKASHDLRDFARVLTRFTARELLYA